MAHSGLWRGGEREGVVECWQVCEDEVELWKGGGGSIDEWMRCGCGWMCGIYIGRCGS